MQTARACGRSRGRARGRAQRRADRVRREIRLGRGVRGCRAFVVAALSERRLEYGLELHLRVGYRGEEAFLFGHVECSVRGV